EQYAFLHLSFQDYFAACYLEKHILSPRWLLGKRTDQCPDQEALRAFARSPLWRETLVILFELLATQDEWPQTLAELLFGEGLQEIRPGLQDMEDAAILLAQVA